ncbi:hypothetical protein Esti_000609 [Eimeria stiedai]
MSPNKAGGPPQKRLVAQPLTSSPGAPPHLRGPPRWTVWAPKYENIDGSSEGPPLTGPATSIVLPTSAQGPLEGGPYCNMGPRSSMQMGAPSKRGGPLSEGASERPFGAPELARLIAKVDVLAHLLKARVGLPLLYPLNSRGLTDPLQNTGIACSRWKREEILLGLSQVAPVALALSKVGSLLRGARALKLMGPSAGVGRESLGGAPKGAPPRPRRTYRESNHFLRPQVWRVVKPGEERATKHLKWR